MKPPLIHSPRPWAREVKWSMGLILLFESKSVLISHLTNRSSYYTHNALKIRKVQAFPENCSLVIHFFHWFSLLKAPLHFPLFFNIWIFRSAMLSSCHPFQAWKLSVIDSSCRGVPTMSDSSIRNAFFSNKATSVPLTSPSLEALQSQFNPVFLPISKDSSYVSLSFSSWAIHIYFL